MGMALESPLANCNGADTTKWNADTNHAQWQADMTSCGTKCLGRHDCVVTCMEGKSWSDGCAGCWGDLQQCTATHCLAKCIGGRTPDCVSCLKAAGCDTKAFGAGSCTGFDAPTMALEAPLAWKESHGAVVAQDAGAIFNSALQRIVSQSVSEAVLQTVLRALRLQAATPRPSVQALAQDSMHLAWWLSQLLYKGMLQRSETMRSLISLAAVRF